MVNVKLRLVATEGYIVNAQHIKHDQAKQSKQVVSLFLFLEILIKGQVGGGIETYAGPGRKGDDNSWPKSSFSEFLREPGTECTEKRLLVGV